MNSISDANCIPIAFKTILKLSKTKKAPKICSSSNFVRQWLEFGNEMQKCAKACVIQEYSGTINIFNKWFGTNNTLRSKLGIDIYFPTDEIKVQEEYLIYTLDDIVGIIGGTMGLFLGFSFYDNFKHIINPHTTLFVFFYPSFTVPTDISRIDFHLTA